jgi:hypothetical protein
MMWITAAMAIGWAGTWAVGTVSHQWEMKQAVNAAVLEIQKKERSACAARVSSVVDQINSASEASVAEGEDAAALVPLLKEKAELIARCKASTSCRTILTEGIKP